MQLSSLWTRWLTPRAKTIRHTAACRTRERRFPLQLMQLEDRSTPAATHFGAVALTPPVAGTADGFTVEALNADNTVDTGYTGTVHFTSTDLAAMLPSDSTLIAGTGTGAFMATFETAGTQTITATDTVTSSITGTSNGVTVVAAAATHFAVSA